MKNLYIAGSCGSIGTQTLDIVRNNPNEFRVIGLSLGSNEKLNKRVVEEFKPELVVFRDKERSFELDYEALVYYGDEGLIELASYSKYENEIFVNALVGISGLLPTVNAIKARKNICLANKETLVAGGYIIRDLIKEYNVSLLPIDSEHNAILELINNVNKDEIKRLIITASGGSFRDYSRDELTNVTVHDALKHPTWSMGRKITIDSATMMNKGFEVIEAHHLFNIPFDRIDTIIHKESIVHSMVEFNDNTIKASLSVPDMHKTISYALRDAHHIACDVKPLSLFDLNLSFKKMDLDRFPCLKYAYMASERGGVYPAVLNASNEAAVYLFLNEKIKFLEIEEIIYKEITSDKYINESYDEVNIVRLSKEIIENIIKERG